MSALESFEASLDQIARSLALDISSRQASQLLDYSRLLQRWSATYNLTALREPAQILSHHLADCMAIVPPLRRWLGEKPSASVLDVGSGAGLPGVVLAVLCPSLQVTCVDAVGKKAAFIRQAAAELRLPALRAEHCQVQRMNGSFDLICSRAFAALAETVRLTQHLLAPQGGWLAMKGKVPDAEIADLPAIIDVFHVEPLQVPGLNAERCLVWARLSTPPAG
jgi:16S rRNA (guanine527-N7)-methyltransferase